MDMDAFSRKHQPTGDLDDSSQDEAFNPRLQPRPTGDGGRSTIGSSDMAQVIGAGRNEYSDEDISLVYEIVLRAETILSEDLTPNSRLPTHALFLAYDEILTGYRIDPNERHISKLVFMVGGVRGQKSLMDKFKAVMARMDITLAIEAAQSVGNEHGHHNSDGSSVGSDAEDLHHTDDDNMSNSFADDNDSNGYKSGGEAMPEESTESLEVARERDLADMAEAFRLRRQAPFSVVATFRTWHSAAHYVNYVCTQSDAARDADLADAACDIFYTWKDLAAEVERAAPNTVLANTYSKRTERIAIRTYQILSIKKALSKWRQFAHLTRYEYQKARNAQLLGDQLSLQDYDGDDFKEDPQLARLAQAAHINLIMSRAFTTWSNRAEEKVKKAEAAARVYEMSLKAKTLDFSRHRSAINAMEQCDVPAGQMVTPGVKEGGPSGPNATQPSYDTYIPSRHHPQAEGSVSAFVAPTRLQTRNIAEKQVDSSLERPSTAIRHTVMPSAATEIPAIGTCALPNGPSEDTVLAKKSDKDASTPEDDQLDEQTMLARRHILRMRYFGAWLRYTSEHVANIEQFDEEIQEQRVLQSMSTWRDQAVARQHQIIDCVVEFSEATSYEKATAVLPKWRERTIGEMSHREQVLEQYADRAEYYQKFTKALPVLRERTKQAAEKEQLLTHYATRSNYYLRATQALSLWQQKVQDVSERRQLLRDFGERADYYYRTRNTLLAWRQKTKQERKQRLKEAHLETRRIVKKGMGERCIQQWFKNLEPSYARYETMNVMLTDILEDRGWQLKSQAFGTWRLLTQERTEAEAFGEDIMKRKAVDQWRAEAALSRGQEPEAREHWKMKTQSRALRTWNLSSLQSANRPEMVTNALEKKERKIIRQGFEMWYGRTADKLVPIELPNGTFKNVGQIVKDARRQGTQRRARGLLSTWRAAAAAEEDFRVIKTVEEVYAPTPGRPKLLFGTFGSRETTTPLAPVPSYAQWQARDSTMGKSDYVAKSGRIGRTRNPKNHRVSWAA
ncbi:hypothetical protein GGS21DRAFT_493154 [Xylaria nigripes]|nr:hypothetical protein GGS21DRAFT_493154 [Xylaria nigripes]